MKHEVLKGALRGRGCGVFTHEMPGETRNAVSFHFFPLNFLHTSSSNSNKRSTSTLADSILLLNGTAGSTPFRRPREEDPPITQLHQHQQLQPYSSVNPRSYSPITPHHILHRCGKMRHPICSSFPEDWYESSSHLGIKYGDCTFGLPGYLCSEALE
jgi:hypothetical protein